MEKQKDQEFAHLEVKRLCGVFGAPLPLWRKSPWIRSGSRPAPIGAGNGRSGDKENAAALSIFMSWCPRRSRR